MTREEAITRLKNIAWLYGSSEREQNIEAIDMAIEALSEPSKVDFHTDESENISTEVNDLISRADAIEAVKHSTAYMHDDLYEAISRIPSAEATGALDEAIAKYVEDGYMLPPSGDLISREDAVKAIARHVGSARKRGHITKAEALEDSYTKGLWYAQEAIRELPTADAVSREDFTKAIKAGLKLQAELNADRPTGQWIELMANGVDGSHWYEYKCSLCGRLMIDETPFCPSCGAKMGGKENE